MIDRISLGSHSGIGASDLQKVAEPAAIAHGLASALGLGAPLRELSSATAAQIGGGSPVASASLERAVLDFGREAKAFTIGHPDLDTGQREARLGEAITAGAAHAAALPDTFTSVDRATALFERAAQHLSGNQS